MDKNIEDMTAEEIVEMQKASMAVSGKAVEPPAAETPAVPTTPAPPDPWAVLADIAAAMKAIAARSTGNDSEAIQTLTTAVMRMADASIEGSKIVAESQIKAVRPSNQVIPERSVFNRRGRDPQQGHMDAGMHQRTIKPPLKCDMFFPWVLEWESLTREEVQLLNLLEQGAYVVKMSDRSKLSMSVQIRYKEDNKTPSMLFVNHDTAFNQSNYRNVPPLSDMLRDMLRQHDRPISQKAAMVLTDEEEEALIEVGEITVTQ